MTDTTSFPSDEELNHLVNDNLGIHTALRGQASDLLSALEDSDPETTLMPDNWEWMHLVVWDAKTNSAFPIREGGGQQWLVPLRLIGGGELGWDEVDGIWWVVEDGEYQHELETCILAIIAAYWDALCMPRVYLFASMGQPDIGEALCQFVLVAITDSFNVAAQVAREHGAGEIVDLSEEPGGYPGFSDIMNS